MFIFNHLLMRILLEMHDHILSGSLSEAIPWETSGEILRFLHEVESNNKVDFGLHMFMLYLVQGLYRQQAAGKAGLACFNLADTGDCITSDLSGGKCDTSGEFSYAKRFACNFEEVHHCFPTAFARHIFSRTSGDTSPYIFMTESRAERYDRQLRDLEARQKKEAVRIRGNGPHTRFRVHFKRALGYVKLRGINKKTVTLHSFKRTGYRQLRRLLGLEAQHVSARAEHRSTLAFVYGARKASHALKPEGGPDERKDMSMAKVLANRSQRKVEFNRVPPHFSPEFIKTIPFPDIVPCYQHLRTNIRNLLPFLLAQLVYHYHKEDDLKLLGHDNPLMKSPLWNDDKWMLYRHTLHANLLGGRNTTSAMTSQLRDEHCDDFVMKISTLQGQATLLESVGTDEAFSQARKIRVLLAEIEGNIETISAPEVQPTSSAFQRSAQASIVSIRAPDHVESTAAEHTLSLPQGIQQQRPGQCMQLQQAPPAFRVPEVLDVRTAWFKFFALGGDKKGNWHSKTAQDIDPSVSGNERKNMRDHFNKAKKVIEMMLGQNTIADVARLGTEHAFQLADAKVTRIWGQDVIGSCGGYKSVRSVYNIMCGRGTSISESTCKEHSLACLQSAWQEPVRLKQASITFAQQQPQVGKAVASSDGGEDEESNNSDESCDVNVDDATMQTTTVLCFLCRECRETRLFPKFARYLAHWKQHRSTRDDHTVQKPMEDEVWHMWARKQGNHSTAQYVAQGGAFMPTWSKEQQRQFLRKRIIFRRILKKHDKLLIRQSDGSDIVVRVMDEALMKKYKEWCIKSVVYLDPTDHSKVMDPKSNENMVCVNVTSVLDIMPCQTPKGRTRSQSPHSCSTPSKKASRESVWKECVQLPTTHSCSSETTTTIPSSLHTSPVSGKAITPLQPSSTNHLKGFSREPSRALASSSQPVSLDPTPFCTERSSQQPLSLRVGASGFHNDGNTCYLRC